MGPRHRSFRRPGRRRTSCYMVVGAAPGRFEARHPRGDTGLWPANSTAARPRGSLAAHEALAFLDNALHALFEARATTRSDPRRYCGGSKAVGDEGTGRAPRLSKAS